jgi:hypothetical protein
MDANMIRLLHHLQRVAFVTLLTAAASPRLLAQTPCPWLLQTIAARWPAAVLAVLGQLVAQRLNGCRLFCYSLLQLLYLLLQRQNNRYESLLIQLCKLTAL